MSAHDQWPSPVSVHIMYMPGCNFTNNQDITLPYKITSNYIYEQIHVKFLSLRLSDHWKRHVTNPTWSPLCGWVNIEIILICPFNNRHLMINEAILITFCFFDKSSFN